MKGRIEYQGQEILYELTYKPVKNINLRVHTDKTVSISVSKRVGKQRAEEFLLSKASWILSCWERMEQMEASGSVCTERPLWDERVFQEILDQWYPQFQQWISCQPSLVIRTMKTRWGSCTPAKKKITMNRILLYAPRELIECVMVHELCHFAYADHSPRFYGLMDQMLPEHRQLKWRLESLHLL